MLQALPTLERWEKASLWPLAGVAVVFLVAYSAQVLVRPRGITSHALNATMYFLYLLFVIDYLVRLAIAPHRKRWFFRHILDLITVALPFLGPLRVLRLVVLVESLQKAFGGITRGRVALYTTYSAVLLVYVASLAVLAAERSDPHANIKTFGNAVWWSITTITTVGYGDLYPVTVMGRVIAVLLMIGGISLIGVITATVASWIVQRVSEGGSADRAATAAQIDELRSEISRLSTLVANQAHGKDPAAHAQR